MKKVFVLLAACMLIFACASGNKGVDYIRKAKNAIEKGDSEQAKEYMSDYFEWCVTASEEDVEESLVEMKEVFGDMTENIYEDFASEFSDYMDDFNDTAEELGETIEDATKELGKEIDKALEDIFN